MPTDDTSGEHVNHERHIVAPQRLIEDTVDPQAWHFAMLERVVRQSAEFDPVHYHVEYLHFPFSRRLACPHLTTLHWRLDTPGLEQLYHEFADIPLVSISDAQRRPLPWLNWQATVYHGLSDHLYTFRERPGDYLAFLGRIAPEKRPDRAVEIARRAGVPLVIPAKVDNADRSYFEHSIQDLFCDPLVKFCGEVTDSKKDEFLGNARALLFPIDWPEPFGLVMVEALACGTPVIAFRNGSVPEIIDDGVTGFIVDTIEEAVVAVGRTGQLNRRRCRQAFQERFTAARMAHAYLKAYEKVLADQSG
ncbi:glycosyltransferase family 4 protein [Paraburkholderia sediminicola]|uniref:Glycosyltransferase family 4 protein n=1 Tax=Paraburkholderia rhynchosiae TaxID=487049 RepID=A0ACC7NP78_9BURK